MRYYLHFCTVSPSAFTLITTNKPWRLDMLRILDTAITLTFYTIIAVAAVLVLGAFFWIIDTIKRFHDWLRGKRYRSIFVPPPRKRKRHWWWQVAYDQNIRRERFGFHNTDNQRDSTNNHEIGPLFSGGLSRVAGSITAGSRSCMGIWAAFRPGDVLVGYGAGSVSARRIGGGGREGGGNFCPPCAPLRRKKRSNSV